MPLIKTQSLNKIELRTVYDLRVRMPSSYPTIEAAFKSFGSAVAYVV